MFDEKMAPLSNDKFMSHHNEMILVVDWDHENMFLGFDNIEDQSIQQVNSKKKRNNIRDLLINNTGFKRNCSDVCSKCACS